MASERLGHCCHCCWHMCLLGLWGCRAMNEQPNRWLMTDEVLKELQQRNEQRLQEAKEALGPKWILHAANQQNRKDVA